MSVYWKIRQAQITRDDLRNKLPNDEVMIDSLMENGYQMSEAKPSINLEEPRPLEEPQYGSPEEADIAHQVGVIDARFGHDIYTSVLRTIDEVLRYGPDGPINLSKINDLSGIINQTRAQWFIERIELDEPNADGLAQEWSVTSQHYTGNYIGLISESILTLPDHELSARDASQITDAIVLDLARITTAAGQRFEDFDLGEPFDEEVTADVNIVDENDGLLDDHQLSMENEFPAGEGDSSQHHRPGLSGPGGNLPRIEGAVEDDALSDVEPKKLGAILALVPTDSARSEIAAALGDRLHEDPDDLHITLLYLGKELDAGAIDKVKDCLTDLCSSFDPLDCRMQGLGVFDHEDDGGRPFYASIDAIGMSKMRVDILDALEATGIEIEHKYDFTPHMTLGYIDPDVIDLNEGSPGIEWISDKIILMDGGEHTEFKLGGSKKQAGGFGIDLLEVATPSKGQGFTDNPADNHETENISEDPDLKLGEVEDPYSISDGPLNIRFDDGLDPNKRHNIVKGADPEDKEAVGIADNAIDENINGPGYSRLDQAIPRDPMDKGPLYGI